MKDKVGRAFKVLAMAMVVGAMPLAVAGSCDVVPGAVDFVIYGDGHGHDDYVVDIFVDDGCCYYDDEYYYEEDYYYWP